MANDKTVRISPENEGQGSSLCGPSFGGGVVDRESTSVSAASNQHLDITLPLTPAAMMATR